jgi:prepilin-type N-terminal cleavage/methylation domain-containing protein
MNLWQQSSLRFRLHNKRNGFTLIELLAVVGIAALLLTLATAAFFGVMGGEDAAKGKQQFKDLVANARQEAIISGKPTLVLCWNSNVEHKIGNKVETTKQGHYAVFQYIGNAWPSPNDTKVLGSPFGLEREIFDSLRADPDNPLPIFNLADKSDDKPVKLKYVRNNINLDKTERERAKREVRIDHFSIPVLVEGSSTGDTLEIYNPDAGDKNQLGCLALDKGVSRPTEGGNSIPLATRTSSNYSLPEGYYFSNGRTIIFFNSDGTARESVSVTLTPTSTKKNTAQVVSISKDGDVQFQK